MRDSKADIVFLVNTEFYMDEAIENIKSNLNLFVEEVERNNVDSQYALVEFHGFYLSIPSIARTYNWLLSAETCKDEIDNLKAHGINEEHDFIGFYDAVNSIKNMDFRSDTNKYIIMITDAEIGLATIDAETNGLMLTKNLTLPQNNNTRNTSDDNIIIVPDDIVPIQPSDEMCFSAVTYFAGYGPYESIINSTNGAKGNVRGDFATNLKSLISGMGESEGEGFYVKLSNGFIVRLDKDPSLNDDSVDTDNDGIPDIIELGEFKTVTIQIPFINKSVEYEYWTFYSNPHSVDTDGDGLTDLEDLTPLRYDTYVIADTPE